MTVSQALLWSDQCRGSFGLLVRVVLRTQRFHIDAAVCALQATVAGCTVASLTCASDTKVRTCVGNVVAIEVEILADDADECGRRKSGQK